MDGVNSASKRAERAKQEREQEDADRALAPPPPRGPSSKDEDHKIDHLKKAWNLFKDRAASLGKKAAAQATTDRMFSR
jgi:hypothetical protein